MEASRGHLHQQSFGRLAMSIGLAHIGLHLMSLVETMIVGRLSVADLAAAGIGRSLSVATMMVPFGWINVLESMSARAIGAGDRERAWAAFRVAVRSALLIWLPSLSVMIVATQALPLIGLEVAVVSRVRLYLLGQAPGAAMLLVFHAGSALLRAQGRVLPSLAAIGAANLTNLALGSLLVRGDAALTAVGLPRLGMPTLGAFGCGLSFTLANAAMLAVVLPALVGCRETGGVASLLRRELGRLGLPAGLLLLAEVGSVSAVTLLAGTLGAPSAAAHSIAMSLTTFSYLIALGVSGATAIRVGFIAGGNGSVAAPGNLGLLWGLTCSCVAGAGLFLARKTLVGLFSEDSGVALMGSSVLGVSAIFLVADGIQCVAGGALRGLGDVRFPLAAGVVAYWLVGLPLGWGLGVLGHLGLRGLWLGLMLATALLALILCCRFWRLSTRRGNAVMARTTGSTSCR